MQGPTKLIRKVRYYIKQNISLRGLGIRTRDPTIVNQPESLKKLIELVQISSILAKHCNICSFCLFSKFQHVPQADFSEKIIIQKFS